MKKHTNVIDRFIQRHSVLLPVLTMMTIPLLIIFLPVMMYGLLFQGVSFSFILSQEPWGITTLVIAIAVALSLIQAPWGVSIELAEKKSDPGAAVVATDDETAAADVCLWTPDISSRNAYHKHVHQNSNCVSLRGLP